MSFANSILPQGPHDFIFGNFPNHTVASILISSAGRRVELLACFRQAAQALGRPLRIIATDAVPAWSPACVMADHAETVPRCTSPGFLPAMMEICRKHQVRLIVPTIDTELPVYAHHRKTFEEMGVQVLVADPEIIGIIRDKSATAHFLAARGIPGPRTWTVAECLSQRAEIPWPVFVKPRAGSGSKGTFLAHAPETIESAANPESLTVQEHCAGDEFTINAFLDGQGRAVSCVPHRREFVRDGEVCFAETQRIAAFTEAANGIASAWPSYYGPLCFQGFRDSNQQIRVFEINGRFGGGYPICDHAGGTFARWILQRLWNLTPDYHDAWREGVRMLRYDAAVFTEEDQRC